MIVAKFGGTSVRDGLHIRAAIDIVREYIDAGQTVVLVASAMGATTDRITRLLTRAEEIGNMLEDSRPSDSNLAERLFNRDIKPGLVEIGEMHFDAFFDIEEELGSETKEQVDNLLQNLNDCLYSICAGKNCDSWARAEILAFGELMSTAIIDGIAADEGVLRVLLDSRELLCTPPKPPVSNVIRFWTNKAIKDAVVADGGRMYIAQGFIAADRNGRTTTFSRGGSDYSASIYAAALDAERVEIWTDVNGVMTTDPRRIPEARTIEYLSYTEAAELAYFGARVIHPATMLPIIRKNIPMVVANASDPHGPKTIIGSEQRQRGVQAVAFKQGITVVNIQSYRMLKAHGFLEKIFAVFSEYNTAVDLISTSEVSLSLTIDDDSSLDIIKESLRLRHIGRVEVEIGRSIVSLVGYRLWRRAELLSEVFSTLRDIPIELISLGASETNLSMVVADKHALQSVELLHARFFEEE